jgi:hypothetical protein
MDYFDLFSDEEDESQWWLGTPRTAAGAQVNVWALTTCRFLPHEGDLVVPLLEAGEPRDIVFGAFDVPYVSTRVADIFEKIAGQDIQRIRAKVEDGRAVEIVNLLNYVDCLDLERSVLTYGRDGKPNMVLELRIASSRVGVRHAFRIAKWGRPFIISERILQALQEVEADGYVATRVT